MRSWIEAGFEQAHMRQQSVRELASELPGKPFVLDVRSESEWNSGHIAGAKHIPGGDLPTRVGEVPGDQPVHVICGSGYRVPASPVAFSPEVGLRRSSTSSAAWELGTRNISRVIL
jgi:hydroxyacylglutathione hydrolase